MPFARKYSESRHIAEKINLIGHNTKSHGNSFFFLMIVGNKVIILIQEKLDDHLNLGQHYYFEELNNWKT